MSRIKIEDLPVLDELDGSQTVGIAGGSKTVSLVGHELTHAYQQKGISSTGETYDWSPSLDLSKEP